MHEVEPMMEHTIGTLSRTAEVSVETLRFYEREGLLEPTSRNGRGWRRYDASSLATVRFIKGAQRAGFALAEIRALLERRGDGEALCAASREAAERKLDEVEAGIRELLSVRAHLRRELGTCATSGRCTVVARIGE